MLHVKEIVPSHSELRAFVRLPLVLHKDDPNYIIPSIEQQVRGLLGRHNALITNGVQAFLMAYDGDRAVGRLLAGIDFRSLQQNDTKTGYISMFECIDDQNAANALFKAAESFLKLNGVTSMIGPSPTLFDDFGTGLLVKGFEEAPSFLSPYNPPYYPALFENAGFAKLRDHFSYNMDLHQIHDERYESVLGRAGKRFGYRVENINLRQDLKPKARELARVMAESTPKEWNTTPPTSETLYRELKRVQHILWPEYTLAAYAGDRPIGILLTIPDCNPMLRGLRGNMFPIGTFRTLFMRSYVKRLRTVMLYVIPEYQNKGVELSMIDRVLQAGRENGIRDAEASMINEQNLKLQLGVEKLGGTISKVYRQYSKEI